MARLDNPTGTTLARWVGRRAEVHGDRLAVTFIDDSGHEHEWTYAQLWQHACAVASALPAVDQASPRGLLLYPPGLDFIAGFFGCQIAGWTPVPTCYPKPGRAIERLDSVAADCDPAALLADQATLAALDPAKLSPITRALTPIATDTLLAGRWIDPDSIAADSDSLALLQYTSGSTSDPKGVMVRQRHLMSNLEAIRQGFGIQWQNDDRDDGEFGVFWLPSFHDMGLIG